jgi:long-chain fatty acid transport protein
MKRILTGVAITALGTSGALAAGVERSTQSVAILFEQGSYAELNFGYLSPDVSGTVGGGLLGSGDMAPGYLSYSLGYKQALNDRIDLAVILDQPIGADVDYPLGTGYPLAGTTADLDSQAVTGLVRYRLPNDFSIYGGLRAQSVKGVVSLPFVAGYTLETNRDYRLGYVVGAAWERPDIAARVALTYNSAITHTLDATEFGAPAGSFETEIPQSWNLEFQTGIMADTLLFGSIRWVEWSAFDIAPPAYIGLVGEPLVSYDSDRVTYTLGVGRRFSDTWSGAVTLGYEPRSGDLTGNLGPTDGYTSIGVAATYTSGNMRVTGGLRYLDIGDATVRPPIGAEFSGNNAIAAGIRVGYSF